MLGNAKIHRLMMIPLLFGVLLERCAYLNLWNVLTIMIVAMLMVVYEMGNPMSSHTIVRNTVV